MVIIYTSLKSLKVYNMRHFFKFYFIDIRNFKIRQYFITIVIQILNIIVFVSLGWSHKRHFILYRSFSLTSRDVTTFSLAYFSVIFSMFCIEQAKIYREPKFGSDRAFGGWTIGKLKCQILAWLTRGRHVGVPLWYTNMAAKKLRPK